MVHFVVVQNTTHKVPNQTKCEVSFSKIGINVNRRVRNRDFKHDNVTNMNILTTINNVKFAVTDYYGVAITVVILLLIIIIFSVRKCRTRAATAASRMDNLVNIFRKADAPYI